MAKQEYQESFSFYEQLHHYYNKNKGKIFLVAWLFNAENWFCVYKEGKEIQRHNAAYVDTVVWEDE
jgi:hypothetical protein